MGSATCLFPRKFEVFPCWFFPPLSFPTPFPLVIFFMKGKRKWQRKTGVGKKKVGETNQRRGAQTFVSRLRLPNFQHCLPRIRCAEN